MLIIYSSLYTNTPLRNTVGRYSMTQHYSVISVTCCLQQTGPGIHFNDPVHLRVCMCARVHVFSWPSLASCEVILCSVSLRQADSEVLITVKHSEEMMQAMFAVLFTG